VTFRLFFLGAEQPTHVRLMQDSGIDAMGLSFWSLQKRLPKRKAWLVSERLPSDAHVFLDSGGYSANRAMASIEEWESYAATYRSFVEANIDAVEMVSEFDCLALGAVLQCGDVELAVADEVRRDHRLGRNQAASLSGEVQGAGPHATPHAVHAGGFRR
jgi:hypothetical protein